LVFASLYGDGWRIVSFAIYGATMVFLYLSSTLYHSFVNRRIKTFFRFLDHSAIYLLIAGTYTPITLVAMRGKWGWTLFALIWTLAISGIVFEAFFFGRFRIIPVIIYLGMGWLVLVAIKPISEMVPKGMFLWLILGGLFYSFGVIFYAIKKIPFQHMIWHLFVLAGSISHFFGIFLYLAYK
jgi:hemolysin III